MSINIDAKTVQQLREKTGAGMMDCKKALIESQGDYDKAIEILRLKGAATAEKKAGRSAKDGAIALQIVPNLRSGILFELNCETDFVSSTDQFQDLLKLLLKEAVDKKYAHSEQFPKEIIIDTIAKLGENISIGRYYRFECNGAGLIGAYLHPGTKPNISKLGVLVELAFKDNKVAENEKVKMLVRDIAMQIASLNPEFICPDDIPSDILEKEKEIYREQARQEGKPEKIFDKIIEGKLVKYYSMVCLVEQNYIKDEEIKVGQLIKNISKEIDDEIRVVRFARIKIGESK